MSISRLPNRSRGSLIAAIALALLGTLVVGSEDRRREASMVVAQAPAPVIGPNESTDEDLDLAKLQRAKASAPIVDVFQQKVTTATAMAPVSAPAPVVPPPPPAPEAAPALPFRFVGRFSEDGVVRLLLAKAEHEYHVAGGETIDGVYSVDEISDGAVTFTYLPLKLRQTLLLPSASEGNP